MTGEQRPAGDGRLRLTVASGEGTADLLVPSVIPLAELEPQLAREARLLDADRAPAGFRVLTAVGRELDGERGLLGQGVEDGDVLTVSARSDDARGRVYDDLADAMSEVVVREMRPWRSEARHAAAVASGGVLLLVGAAGLARGSPRSGIGAAVVAVALLGAALVVSRRRVHWAAPVLTCVAAAYAAVAGLTLTSTGPLLGRSGVSAGAGVLLVGLVSALAVEGARVAAVAQAVIGVTLLVTGTAVEVVGPDPAVASAAGLTGVVVAGSWFPWLALTVTGVLAAPAHGDAARHVGPVDQSLVAADAHLAHEVLLGLSIGAGIAVVLAVPATVSLGPAGTTLALLCCLVVGLRTRDCYSHRLVSVGLAASAAGATVGAGSVLVLHPGWRPGVAVGLVAAGAALLWPILRPILPRARPPRVGSVRWAHLADRLEAVASVALLPALLVASGAVAAVRG